jgi:hypothetical protein
VADGVARRYDARPVRGISLVTLGAEPDLEEGMAVTSPASNRPAS